uniref:Uncharacterized protein n=1 Tax=Anguilla anguilla TaxID=7936 RepID=A0A0E9X0P7_ANGAN
MPSLRSSFQAGLDFIEYLGERKNENRQKMNFVTFITPNLEETGS